MSGLVLFFLLFIVFELFEVWWQKAPTLYGVLERVYHYYQRSIFLLFFMHPTLYLSIYLMMLSGYDLYLQILLGFKFGDIAIKLLFVQKVFIKRNVDEELSLMLKSEIEWYMLYFGVLFYPLLIFLGFS